MNIEQKRKEKKLTQRELAEVCNTNQNNISRYEKGERMPNLMMAKSLAKALDCTVDELLKDDDDDEE